MKVTKIDTRLGDAFVAGENLDFRGEYSVQSYDGGSQIYVGRTPIMWFNKPGGYLRFSLNKQDIKQVRSRLNGLLQYLYEIATLDHIWKFVISKGRTCLVEDNGRDCYYSLPDDKIMTVLPVYALNVPNKGTRLFLSSPDDATKMNIEKGVFVAPTREVAPTQEAAFLTFDDLSGVC